MLQGGREARAEQGRDVMFFVGFLFAFLIPYRLSSARHCFQSAFLLHDTFKRHQTSRLGLVPVTETQ
jgi:hypothetical protein